ncbi:glucan biosynthesis protein D [Novosphingobium sp. 1949]|uniref:Glucan biosynthesis protein D n=1 Tax=Novosphingobium organovorum TaxID=2930092 RepID=A0ABT0BE82_9SPHN|nr:glucan biosynthesis protein D [Novosphingobium organovorum]MCJ2183381.1 glucan biosynthesis protein D [Novosphingobium organovorum]
MTENAEIPFFPAAMNRREAAAGLLGLAALLTAPGALAATGAPAPRMLGKPEPFSWDRLVAMARKSGARAYVQPPVSPLAAKDFDTLARLTYGDASAVADVIRFFPTALAVAPYKVEVAIIEGASARPVVDTSSLFVDGTKADIAGFRVMAADGHADWLSFMGASYFRTSGARDQFGISARGLAIDTGLASGEEFPVFTHFWIEHVEADHFVIYALLDGPSVAGAYRIDTNGRPESGVIQDIKAQLFFRKDVKQLGLAAMSSMFWYDQSSRAYPRPPRGPDWRPEVHDSDGLAIRSGNGEQVWRPLENALSPTTFSFTDDSPKGFGLLQRDQNFDHYQDDGSWYDKRPSLWIEPTNDWGKGAVKLYEMPTNNENQDNIAAFWTPAKPVRAGDELAYGYRLSWTNADPSQSAIARCVDDFMGKAGLADAPAIDGARKVVFDFAGPALAGLDRSSGVDLVAEAPEGVIMSRECFPVAGTRDRWRAKLDIRLAKPGEAGTPMDLRLFLRRGDAALTETVIKAFNV